MNGEQNKRLFFGAFATVCVAAVKVEDRAMEPWGMGAPEFRIKLMGASPNKEKSYELGPIFYFDFKNTKCNWWKHAREQSFNTLVYEWLYDAYEENYDVITFYVQEQDGKKIKKLSLEGNIGVKASAGLNSANNSNNPNLAPFSVGASTEHKLAYEVNFVDDEDMGWRTLFYFDDPNKVLEFNGVGRMKVQLGQ